MTALEIQLWENEGGGVEKFSTLDNFSCRVVIGMLY